MGTGRLDGWEMRLTKVVNDWMRKEFSWENHCGLFVGDCVLAVTGHDPVADIRGNIKTARDWVRSLKQQGGFLAAMDNRLGSRIEVTKAQMGDVVVRRDRWYSAGVHIGGKAAFLADKGLCFLPASDCALAWAVGRG